MKKRLLWKKIKQRGAIIWKDADGLMRDEGNLYVIDEDGNLTDEVFGWCPRTYTTKGVPAYDTWSALIPCGNKKNPKIYRQYKFDEDEGRHCEDDVFEEHVHDPLHWKTEREWLDEHGFYC